MKVFTKSDLKPGMLVHTRKEGTYFVLDLPFDDKGTNERILFGEDGFLYLDKYNDDMTLSDRDGRYDIMTVYDITGKYGLGFGTVDIFKEFDVLYERKESHEDRLDDFAEKMKIIFENV